MIESRKLIIGSTAMRHHFPDFNREPKDVDYAVEDAKYFTSSREVEYLENPVLFKYVKDNQEYIDPNMLLSLKMSHLFFDINWAKHMWDVRFLLNKGCIYDIALIEELYNFWKDFHPRHRRSNLEVSKDEFFTNAINYDNNEHDILHTYINPVPMYTKILADGKDVEISEDKFNLLTLEEQLDVVREEVYVMAYERYKNYHFMIANAKMLKKFIMQHAPMWMFPFVVKNYVSLNRANINFINLIEKQLQNGKTSTVN
jgi:hypothetical protein